MASTILPRSSLLDSWNFKEYTINAKEVIGSGSYGIVYKASDSSGKPVAAKSINLKMNPKLLKQNLKNLLHLDHQNIVEVMDIHKEDDTLWMFMQFCKEGDLNKFMLGRHTSSEGILEVMQQIVSGVEYLHKSRIIHRDIKPANILVHRANPLSLKLTDFDFSKCLDPNVETSVMTSNVGTMAFKAPEFFRRTQEGKIRYHKSIDIYACGLTFLALVQAKGDNKILIPQLETAEDPSELIAPIGLTMVTRQRYGVEELSVVALDDESESIRKEMKKLIKAMTDYFPGKRPTASEVLLHICSLQGQNPMSHTKNPENLNMRLPKGIDKKVRTLECVKTWNTGMNLAHFTALNHSDHIVVRGRLNGCYVIRVFDRTEGSIITEIDSRCNHDFCAFASYPKDPGLIVEICRTCDQMRRYDTACKENLDVFFLQKPRAICSGTHTSFFVVNDMEYLLEVQWPKKCRSPTVGQSLNIDAKNILGLCFVEQHDTVVVTSPVSDSPGYVKAVKLGDGTTQWILRQINERKTDRSEEKYLQTTSTPVKDVDPGGLCADNSGNIFVADTGNKLLLLIDGQSGDLVQVFHLKKGYVQDVCWSRYQPHLTVAYGSVLFELTIGCYNVQCDNLK